MKNPRPQPAQSVTAPRTLSRVVPDPTALKALTHPVRLRMLGMLRVDGPRHRDAACGAARAQ